MNKRLYKSNKDIMLFGVCGGIAEYFDIDPTIVRLIVAALVLGMGSGLIIYLVAAIVMPKNPY